MPNVYICKTINDNVYGLQDPTGHVRHGTVADTQLIMPAEYIISILPDNKNTFG